MRAFHEGEALWAAVDPGRFPGLVGQTVDLYVCASRDVAGWTASPTLVDLSGGAESLTVSAAGVAANRRVVDPGTLSGDAGFGLGVGYDVIVDGNRNGLLDAGDVIDGFDDHLSAAYVVRDPTLAGPLAVSEILYSGGPWLGQKTYYPAAVAGLGALPLVVVGHGNGHNYQWYNHIGRHLASYGYVVMSHENNTGPGIETASQTTLTNTDFFLNHLATIAGGALDGHVDATRLVWIGHSRGGEGVVRAYDKLADGTHAPTSGYALGDIRLISSIAPTDFLGPTSSTPHGATYHLWTGGADADVHGCASCDLCQTFHLVNRAEGLWQSISLHGVGHADFHDGGGLSVASGPCLVGRPDTHTLMRGYLLPLAKRYTDANAPAKDYLWRQWESFRPPGAPASECVVVDLMYTESGAPGSLVIDDFQSAEGLELASSGARVRTNLLDLVEGRLDDVDAEFNHTDLEAMNGMTQGGPGDSARGAVFSWTDDRFLIYRLAGLGSDLSLFAYLSFRACQGTRHPLTDAASGDLVFEVALRDAHGTLSTVSIGAYGGGIEEPYQRTTISFPFTECGVGDGWANEFETVRLRLEDFRADGSGLDLGAITHLRFAFGPSHGSPEGRLGLDDVVLVAPD